MPRLVWDEIDRHPRWLLGVLAAGGIAVALAVAGLPPVSIHGPLHYVGIMDPLCGMTRAARLFARGNLSRAWRYNPGSFVLAAFAFGVVSRACVGVLAGRWVRIVAHPRLAWIACAVVVGLLEVNQQLHASLLR